MPAKYCIRVRGTVDEQWSNYFGDMTITVPDEENHPEDTQLAGELTDSSALMGVLYRLYSLGFELLSVQKIAAVMAAFLGASLIGYVFERAISQAPL